MATSYANPGGTGDRRSSIWITADRGFLNRDDYSLWLDGVADNSANNFPVTGTSFQGKSITFDFRTGKIVDEIRLYVETGGNSQGAWDVSGSNDGVNFTSIATAVSWTGTTTKLLTFTNSTSYRYLRITGESGTITQTHWREIEFKIDQGNTDVASSTSYSNTGGTGDRTASITLTQTSGLFNSGTLSVFVDGASANNNYIPSGTGFQGKSVTFDFGVGAAKVIDEIRLVMAGAEEQGTWQVSASNNGTDWTNLGGNVIWPRLATRVVSFFNLDGYRYYRMTGVSGTIVQNFMYEYQFRIDDYVAPPEITTTTLPDGTETEEYEVAIEAAFGTAPYAWDVSAGDLPDGITLAADGVLSGTPTESGTFNFTARVTDDDDVTDTQALQLIIAEPDPAITTTTLPDGTENSAYEQTLAATDGTAPLTWDVSAGTLPDGLTLSSAGVLSGTPTEAGTFNFTVRVTDDDSRTDTQALELVIAEAEEVPSTGKAVSGVGLSMMLR
jgi:hypothetical protein